MVPDTYPDLKTTISTTLCAQLAASDPWDMPYFGAPVYFTYQPSLSAPSGTAAVTLVDASGVSESASAASTSPSLLSFDPWDAPYFGGGIFLKYPAFPVVLPKRHTLDSAMTYTPSVELPPALVTVTDNISAVISTPRTRELSATKKRHWFACLFGQR
jgi:hypothetical protein